MRVTNRKDTEHESENYQSIYVRPSNYNLFGINTNLIQAIAVKTETENKKFKKSILNMNTDRSTTVISPIPESTILPNNISLNSSGLNNSNLIGQINFLQPMETSLFGGNSGNSSNLTKNLGCAQILCRQDSNSNERDIQKIDEEKLASVVVDGRGVAIANEKMKKNIEKSATFELGNYLVFTRSKKKTQSLLLKFSGDQISINSN